MSKIKQLIYDVERLRNQPINGALTDEAAAELEALQAVAQAVREIIDYDRIYPDVLTGDVPKRLSDTIKKLAAALEKL